MAAILLRLLILTYVPGCVAAQKDGVWCMQQLANIECNDTNTYLFSNRDFSQDVDSSITFIGLKWVPTKK